MAPRAHERAARGSRYRVSLPLFAALLGAAAVGAPAGCTANETSICETSPGLRKVSGGITRGKSAVKVTGPVVLEGVLTAEPFIDYLLVGGARAENKGTNFSAWSITLSQLDLEQNRDGNDALIAVKAVDVCGDAHPIDETRLPIGADPTAPVTGLDLQITIPMGECYLPASGSAAAAVKVVADAEFIGAVVTLSASQGTFAPPGAPLQLPLAADGDMASAQVFFSSMTAGTALLVASAQGAAKGPLAVPIAAAPKISGDGATIDRDEPYSVFVSSTGNLASCHAEATHAGEVTLTIADPALGDIDGDEPVKEATLDCAKPELLRVEVKFAATAPDAAQVKLVCSDTFGQEGSATIGVNPMPSGGP